MTSGANHIEINEELTQENIAKLEEFALNDKPLMLTLGYNGLRVTALCPRMELLNVIVYGVNLKAGEQVMTITISKENGRWYLGVTYSV